MSARPCYTQPPSAGYQVSINGTDVDDHVLKPGWTSYTYRTVHDTTDVTALSTRTQRHRGAVRRGLGDRAIRLPHQRAAGIRQPASRRGRAAHRLRDLDVLRAQFESMRAWTDLLLRLAGERHLWEGQFQYGDWLDPTAPPEYPADAKTSQDLVATAYVFRSADLTSRAAELLGDEAAAAYYAESAAAVRAAFLAEYVTPAGRMMSDAQTAYALGIVFGAGAD